MSETQAPAGRGHNRPPQPLDAALLSDWLEPELEELRDRRTALLDALVRFHAQHVPIRDDEVQGNAAEFVRQLRAFVQAAEELRRKLGQPYRECTTTLNAAFHRLERDVIAGREAVDDALTAYAKARAEEEKAQREAEAAARRQAAELAELQARHSQDDAAWDRAVDTAQRAEKAAGKAQAPQAELSRVRGDMGAVATLRTRWDWEVEELDAVPRQYLQIDPRKVREAIDAGAREIAGLRIFDASRAVVR